MQLSKRLQAVADLVTPGSRVADVGCDHAYTSIYLVEKQIATHIIAMDVNQGPIDRAKDNIERYGYSNQIEPRKSNGLDKLLEKEADTLLIAGMGGLLILQILNDKLKLVKQMKELILQPQSDIDKVRCRLQELDFRIVKESMVKDEGKYYMMMKAIPREMVSEPEVYELTNKEHYYYGKLLLLEKHPVLLEFLYWELGLCEDILRTLKAQQSVSAKVREKEMEEKITMIQNGIEYYI